MRSHPSPTTSGQQYTAVSTPPVTEPESLGGNAPVTTLPARVSSKPIPHYPPCPRASRPRPAPSRRAHRAPSPRRNCSSTGSAPASSTTRSIRRLPRRERTRWSASSLRPARAAASSSRVRSWCSPDPWASRAVWSWVSRQVATAVPAKSPMRGADAHAWPQVYLGPRAGWVSFEPTPQQPRGEVAPEGVVGPSGVSITTPTTSEGSPTTAPPPTEPLTVPTTVPNPSGSNNTLSSTSLPSSGLAPVWWTLIGAATLLGLAARAAAAPAASPLVPGGSHAGAAGAPLPG